MTSREFFIPTIKDEVPRFEKVFKALPKDKLDWRPHEKSRSALELVVSMAVEVSSFPIFLDTGVVDFDELYVDPPKDLDEAVKMFLKSLSEAELAASEMTESEWDEPAKMVSGEKVEWETTKGNMAWSLVLDLVHHRGQLSTYIRPMGGKVPPIYGPSGDTQE